MEEIKPVSNLSQTETETVPVDKIEEKEPLPHDPTPPPLRKKL